MSHRNPTPLLGWILLIIGALLLLNHWHPFDLSWMTLLMILGLGLFVAGVLQRDHGAIFPGTFLFLLGLLFYLKEHSVFYTPWWHLWPLILLCLGISFLMLYIFEPARRGTMIPGAVLIIVGFVFLFFPYSWNDIIYWFGKLWPVLLIILGLHLIIKAARRSRAEG